MNRVRTLRVVRSVAAGGVAVAAIVAAKTAGIFWVLAVVAGCGVLTGAAVWGLKRWSDGKVYYTATQPLQVRAEQVRYVTVDGRPAIVIPAATEGNEP